MAIPRDLALAGEHSRTRNDPSVTAVIRQASRSTGIDFGYLMAQATQESGLRPDAKSATSTATGLFQFTEGTWLDMVRRHGAQHGLGDLAARITTDSAGKPVVGDPATRKAILDLRTDPGLSAVFAAEYARDNKGEVERALGRTAGATDLYFAHFLGATGAGSFLKAVQRESGTPAADLFPEAAAANRSVFYDTSGRARSVGEVYRSLSEKIQGLAGGFSNVAAAPSPVPASPAAVGTTQRAAAILARIPGPRLALSDILTLSAIRLVADGDDRADKKNGPAAL
jgi:hypothetical protein